MQTSHLVVAVPRLQYVDDIICGVQNQKKALKGKSSVLKGPDKVLISVSP